MMEGTPLEASGSAVSAAEDPALGLDRRTKMEILFAVMLGLFLGALDQTIVGPVLPHIVTELNGVDLYTWVVASYLLTSTVTVPIYGKLSDLYGRKPVFAVGIILFLVGSALSGLSQTMWQLIFFRGIQGLGAGALFPIALAVIGDLFTPAERGKYQGLFGAVFGIAFLVGPGLGGFLTDTFSWHWIFYVNIPIGILALIVIERLLPNVRLGKKVTIDYLGVAALVAGLVPILIGLTIAETSTWSDPAVWGTIGGGFVFLVVFVVIEARVKEPVVPLHLFRNRTFSASMVAIFLATFGFGAAIIFLPLYFQVVGGASATESGYKLLPFLFGLIASSIVSGQIVSRTGRYKALIVGGVAILVVGLTLMAQLRSDTPDLVLWSWMFITGLGVGPTFAIFTIIVQNAVPFHELGAATSDLTLFRQIGTTVGLTFGFTLFRINLSWGLIRDQLIGAGAPAQFLPTSAPAGFDIGSLTSVGKGASAPDFFSQIPAALQPVFTDGFHRAFTIALANSMWLGVGAAAIAVVATVFLKEIPLRQSLGPQAAAMAAADKAAASVAAADGPVTYRPAPEAD